MAPPETSDGIGPPVHQAISPASARHGVWLHWNDRVLRCLCGLAFPTDSLKQGVGSAAFDAHLSEAVTQPRHLDRAEQLALPAGSVIYVEQRPLIRGRAAVYREHLKTGDIDAWFDTTGAVIALTETPDDVVLLWHPDWSTTGPTRTTTSGDEPA